MISEKDNVLLTQQAINCDNFAEGGIRTLGALVAITSNEHPLVRLSGVALTCSTQKNIPLRITSFLLTSCGWILAKNKKKAFIQRTLAIGSTIIGAGIVGTLHKVEDPSEREEARNEFFGVK